MAAILNHPHVYSFLHVPVQCGSDCVLAEMRREYTVSDFTTLLDYLLLQSVYYPVYALYSSVYLCILQYNSVFFCQCVIMLIDTFLHKMKVCVSFLQCSRNLHSNRHYMWISHRNRRGSDMYVHENIST